MMMMMMGSWDIPPLSTCTADDDDDGIMGHPPLSTCTADDDDDDDDDGIMGHPPPLHMC